MSADANEGTPSDRPSREVAYRLFAAEFDDASYSYSESDEERAPNYVVTPTGARVNRLFTVGVLTEVETVNDDVLRGRVVDPTGAFVSYAGQYQPEEMAFLDRASPPAFVALSGKARTFTPDDSDRVFTSVRPESISRVDADTRDRWTVSTAEATLHRIGVMAAAVESGLTGERLRTALYEAGVDESLATGIPRALDHYGTTPAYLAGLRRLARDALEVVAGERDSVGSLDVEPGDVGTGEASLATMAASPDLPTAAELEAETDSVDTVDGETVDDSAAATTVEAAAESTGDSGADDVPEFEASTAEESTTATSAEPSTTDTSSPTESAEPSTPSEAAETTETTETTETSEPEPTTSAEPVENTASTPSEATETAETAESPTSGTSEASESPSATEPEPASESASTSSTSESPDELGDFDADGTTPPEETTSASTEPDELGDFDTGSASSTDADSAADTDDSADTMDDGMYELDESEREEIESEFGTEFSTGSEVAPAGEADIDVPSAEEVAEELDEEVGVGQGPTSAETDPVGGGDETGEEAADAADEPAEDVDLEAAAVEAMAALDDGDGATREAVIASVVDDYGADPEAVEDAIQSALMSGQCYEPNEDSLKAI